MVGIVLAGCALAGTGLLFAFRGVFHRMTVGREWPPAERIAIDEIDHDAWSRLLHKYVHGEGDVDYTGWKASATDLQALDSYLETLSRADPRQPAGRAARLAFWINAYNALTVKGILREYPTTSIQNHVGWLFGYNIWRDLRLVVGDRPYSLGAIEHEVLRQQNEPRIHFALVCASRGCPRLLNEAYTALRLEEQLAANTRAFFADPLKFSWTSERPAELHISPILDWYADDFGTTEADRLQSIVPWLPQEAQALARSGRVRIRFTGYDWSLNDQATSVPLAVFAEEPPLPPVDDYE